MSKLFGAMIVGALIILVIVIVMMIYFSVTIMPVALNIIDIESNLEPVEPYDIAHIESITEMSGSQWEFVVRVIDVETNTTVYDYCIYDVNSGSIFGSDYIKYVVKGGLKT